jgi:hypoxanthine phosphoribosyltransferase
MAEKIGKILITEEEIAKRAKEIAAQIDKDFEGEEVILLMTLKGSILWIGDIMKNLTVKTKLDFISASS